MTRYVTDQLSDLASRVGRIEGQRVRHYAGTIAAANAALRVVDVDCGPEIGLLEGVYVAAPSFFPQVGDDVTIRLDGARPAIVPNRIASGVVGYGELAGQVGDDIDSAISGAAGAQAQAQIALDAANGKNRQTFSPNPAPANGLGGETVGDMWWQLTGSVLVAGWRWNGTAYVTHQFGDGLFDTVNAAKIVTGVLSAGVSITVGDPGGDRVVIDGTQGIEQYVSGYELPAVKITPGQQAYFSATDPLTGQSLATVDGDGKVSGRVGSFESLLIGGREFTPRVDDKGPGAVVQYGGAYSSSAATTTERGWFEVAAELELGRMYLIETTSLLGTSTVSGDYASFRIRMSEDGTTPMISSSYPAIATTRAPVNTEVGLPLRRVHTPTVSGLHRFLLTVGRYSGSGSVTGFGRQDFPAQMWITDIGAYRGNNLVSNDGGGTVTNPKQTITKSYAATWSGTYNSGTLATFYGNSMRQGVGYGNNHSAMFGFNNAQITADLSGATIESVSLYLHASHWHYNSGGTALIGTHTQQSRPNTFSSTMGIRFTQANWPKPGGRQFALPVGVGQEFQSSFTRGFTIGPASNSDLLYYGTFQGAGQSYNPTLWIKYTK